VDQGSWQGAGRRKRGAYTIVCEHFEPIRNTAILFVEKFQSLLTEFQFIERKGGQLS
jgi:hypothetical protein